MERHCAMIIRYVLVSVGSGILFAVMDSVINANPLARNLFQVFEPIARKSINIPLGITIDIIYGFAMAGAFLLLQRSLPGKSPVAKGLFFGLLVWFFRVAMQVASQSMMYTVPVNTSMYILFSGLIEMLILGLVYGAAFKTAHK
jgi:hypothetical protein